MTVFLIATLFVFLVWAWGYLRPGWFLVILFTLAFWSLVVWFIFTMIPPVTP